MVSSQYQISDNLGRFVNAGAIQSESTTIDIRGLSSGLYYISIDDQVSEHRIIKM